VEGKIKKKVLRLVGKLESVLLRHSRSFLYMVKMKSERGGGGGERIKEREGDREKRKNGVAIGFCIFCSFVC
jgi:hypothetical protein